MRHRYLVLLALILTAPSAYAQSRTLPAPLNDSDVVARLMSFDRNDDGRIERQELSERMHALVARGDVNGDAALDGSELQTLARAQQPPIDHRVIIISGSYVFAEDLGFSSRLRIEGALDDLRLEPSTRQRARTIAASYAATLEEQTTADLIVDLDPVLSTNQLLDVSRALEDRRMRAIETINGRLVVAVKHDVVTTALGKELLRRIGGYALSVQQQLAAEAAVERFDSRIRLGQAERAELMALGCRDAREKTEHYAPDAHADQRLTDHVSVHVRRETERQGDHDEESLMRTQLRCGGHRRRIDAAKR